FCALAEELGSGWAQWREALRDPKSCAVASFAGEHKERVSFHCYLQFLADRQLAAASDAARKSGMEIGVVRDLALGINPDGADVWAERDVFASGLRCGAPPDEIAPQGQEWGVLPMHPLRLARNLEPYTQLLRANMKHASGLRIDHVIGLQRQYL